jgi:DNA repair exonuclease SbcCD ATPase subunit
MTMAIARPRPRNVRGPHTTVDTTQRELERRLEQVLVRLEESRRRLRRTQEEIREAEETFMRCRQEREEAAQLVADLAELAESLQRGLTQPECYACIR